VKARVDSDTGLLAAAFAQPYHRKASEALSTVPVIRLATSCTKRTVSWRPASSPASLY
jgi:hypothetical protein